MSFKARTSRVPLADESLHPGVLAAFRFEQRSKQTGWYTKPIEQPFRAAIRARLKRGDAPTVASLLSQADVCLDRFYLAGGYRASVDLLEQASKIDSTHFEVQYLLTWALERLAVEEQDISIANRMKLPAAHLIENVSPSTSTKHKRAVAFAYYATASLLLNEATSDNDVDKALDHGRRAHELRDDAKFLDNIELRYRGRKALLRGIAGDAEGFEELGAAVKNFSASPLGPEVAHPAFVAHVRKHGLKKADAYVNAYESRGVFERAALARTQLAKGAKAKSQDFESFIKLGDTAGIALFLDEADLNPLPPDKNGHLTKSVSEGTLGTTQCLVDHGFPLFQDLMNKVTRVDIAEYLIGEGLDANADALLGSVTRGYPEVTRFFISLGVDPNAKRKGRSAINVAKEAGDKSLLEILCSEPPAPGMDFEFVRRAVKENAAFYMKHHLGNKNVITQVEHIIEKAEVSGVASLNEFTEFVFGRGQHDVLWVFAHAAAEHLGTGTTQTKLSNSAEFIVGDLELEGDLDFSHPIIIAGDLRVSGSIIDGEPDSMLVVSGSVKARNIVSDGSFFVGGDIAVDELIFGHYNHGTLAAGGVVKAQAVVMDDHHFECKTKPQALLYVEDSHRMTDNDRAVLLKAFGEKCFEDDYLDVGFFIDGVRAGRPLLRA